MPNKFIPPQTTTSSRTSTTPIDGEILYDTDEKKLYYGDGSTTGGKTVGSSTVADNTFRIQDNSDATKQIAFEASGITTGTTRTLTTPDASGTIALIDTTGISDKDLFYYDSTSKLFKRIAIGTTDQTLVAKPSLSPPYQWASGTEVLTANRTYYIRTDGSDSNTGLANTSGGAFLTFNKAFNTIATLNKNGYTVTISVADGTYTLTSSILTKDGLNDGDIILLGNSSTPANCVITSSSDISYIKKKNLGNLHIEGFKFTNTGSNNNTRFIQCEKGLTTFKNIDLGATTTGSLSSQFHIYIFYGATCIPTGNYTVSGKALISVYTGGLFCDDATINSPPTSITVTLSGTPDFIYTYYCGASGNIVIANSRMAFSGSATGARFYIEPGGAIQTYGSTQASYFPGNASGTVSTGSVYA